MATEEHPLDPMLDGMLWPAARLVGAVRARDPQEVAAVLEPLDRTGLSALLVAVACMVPDDQTIGQLVLWSHGPHVPDDVYDQLTAFDLNPGMKTCTRCEETLPLKEFHRSESSPDGRKPRCKACISEVVKERKAAAKGRRTPARCEPQRQREAA